MKTSALVPPTIARPTAQPDRITSVAREFESLFTSMMLKAMRKTVGRGSLLPESLGEKIYTGMLDNEYARMIGTQATLGLSDLIEQELRRHEGSRLSQDKLQMPVWMLDDRLIASGRAPLPQFCNSVLV